MLPHQFDELLRRGIHARVVDLKASTGEQHDAEVLADIVEVPLDRAHEHGAEWFDPGRRQDRIQVRHAGLHGASGDEDFGDEDDIVAKLDAYHRHAGDEAVAQDGVRGEILVQSFSGQPVDLVLFADDQVVGDVLHEGIGSF